MLGLRSELQAATGIGGVDQGGEKSNNKETLCGCGKRTKENAAKQKGPLIFRGRKRNAVHDPGPILYRNPPS